MHPGCDVLYLPDAGDLPTLYTHRPNAMEQSRLLDAVTERLRAEYESRVARIKRVPSLIAELREIFEVFPELRPGFESDLRRLAGVPTAGVASDSAAINGSDADPEVDDEDEPEPEEEGQHTGDRMISFFVSRGNAPASIAEIIRAVGKAPTTVKSQLYKRNKGRFVRHLVRDKPNASYWQLSDRLYEAVMRDNAEAQADAR